MSDARAEYGEMNITKLNQRIDSIEVCTTYKYLPKDCDFINKAISKRNVLTMFFYI